MSSFSYKGILSILVSVFLVSGIIYASSTIISVQTQSIAQGDVIANGWFQEVNDSIVSIRNTLTSNTGNLWGKSGNDIYYTGGNVGIGTRNPNSILDITKDGHRYIKLSGQSGWSAFVGGNDDGASASLYGGSGGYSSLSLSNGGVVIGTVRKDLNTSSHVNNFFVSSDGNVGIGTTSPNAKLDVAGSIKIADGTQGVGKVLISDANGLASWNNPLDGVMNYSSQNPGALPQSAGSTVAPAGGYYDYGSFSVSPGIYMWFVYNCAGQLNYTSGGGNSYFMVGSPVIYSSSNWSNLNNTPYNTCGIIYTGVVKVNSIGIISLRISSYQNSVLITPGPTSTAFNVSLVKVF